MSILSHTNNKGKANMVDVSGKPLQEREAIAEGYIHMHPDTALLIQDNQIKKGDVLTVSEIAGIQGGKRTSELIPLCHNIPISKIDVEATLENKGVRVQAYAKCIGQTGIEMEALTAVSIALLTLYDMCKAVDKEMVISDIRLLSKTKK